MSLKCVCPGYNPLLGGQATGSLVLQEKILQQIFSKNVQCTLNIGIEKFLCCETSLYARFATKKKLTEDKENGNFHKSSRI